MNEKAYDFDLEFEAIKGAMVAYVTEAVRQNDPDSVLAFLKLAETTQVIMNKTAKALSHWAVELHEEDPWGWKAPLQ